MKKRNVAAVVILHIITLTIYFFYWTYKTRKDLIAQNGNPKSIPAFRWLLLPYLAILPAIVAIFAIPTSESESAANVVLAIGALLWIFLTIIACLVVFFWWFYHYCKVASEVTKGIEFAPSYVLLIVTTFCNLPVVWQALMQNDINKAADRLATTTKPAAQAS